MWLQRCGKCSWDQCNTDCKALFIDATFGWVIALSLPLTLAVIFMVMGCCGRRKMPQHKSVPCGDFDIIFGPFISSMPPPTRRVYAVFDFVLYRMLADRVLIGACNPMLCPIHAS